MPNPEIDAPQFATQLGHAASITSARFSPDGRFIASVDVDLAMKLWDVASGRQIRTFLGAAGARNDQPKLAWSPDGKSILVAGGPDGLRLWDVVTGRTLRVAPEIHAGVAVFAPDGRWVALASNEALVLWDPATGAVIRTLSGHTSSIAGVAVSADGGLVASGGMDARLILWDARSGAQIRSLASPVEIGAVAMSRDGRLLVSGDWPLDGIAHPRSMVRLWDGSTGESIRVLDGLGHALSSVALSPDEGIVYSGDERAWEVSTGKEVPAYPGSVLSPDGTLALSIGDVVVLRDVATHARVHELSGRATRVGAVCFGERGGRALVGLDNGSAVLWDLATLQPLRTFDHESGDVRTAALSTDGRLAISGGRNNEVRLWDVATGATLHEVRGFNSASAVALSPDGRLALIGRTSDSVVQMAIADETLTLWDTSTGARLTVFEAPETSALSPVQAVAFSSDGRVAISGHTAGVMRWDVATGALLSSTAPLVESFESVDTEALDGDRGLVLTGGNDGVVRAWDMTTGKLIRTFGERGEVVSAVALSPDGGRALSGTQGGALVLWDVATGAQIRALPGHAASVTSIAWSPDGAHVLTGSLDATARICNLATGQSVNLVSRAREWLIYTDDGLFDASPGGASFVAAVQGTSSYAIDQLAVKNNRPDVILDRLALGTPDLRAHFLAQHSRRLARAGLAEAELGDSTALPDARIVRAQQVERWLDVEVELSDDEGLSSYQIYANDVPLFAGRGKPISGARQTIHERVELAPGSNRIEASAVNLRGRESLRPIANAVLDDETPGDLYFLGFGVSRYAKPELDLGFADKDARDLERVLARSWRAGKVHARTLTNQEVTVDAIRRAKSFLEGATARDTFVLFIAGHGGHDRDAAATYYFLTHESDPEDLATTAATFELIEDLLVGIAPRNKLFLMDTCESGELDGPSLRATLELARDRGLTARGARDLTRVSTAVPADPLKRYPWLRGQARFVYLDLTRRSGAIVFSSSRGGELSYESAEIQNGYFTQEILTALTTKTGDTDPDGLLSTDELRAFVTRAVAERSHGLQNPTVDRDNLVQKFSFTIFADDVEQPAVEPAPSVDRGPSEGRGGARRRV